MLSQKVEEPDIQVIKTPMQQYSVLCSTGGNMQYVCNIVTQTTEKKREQRIQSYVETAAIWMYSRHNILVV